MFCIQLNSNVVFWAVFLFHTNIRVCYNLSFRLFFSFSGIKYERERDGRKKRISCSAQFCEKFQTFPIKINSKESSKYFFFCCCCARETKKFFFPFRYHKKNYFFPSHVLVLALIFYAGKISCFHIIAQNRVISERKRKAHEKIKEREICRHF